MTSFSRSSRSSSWQCGSSEDMAALRTNLLVAARRTVLSSSSSSPCYRFYTFHTSQRQTCDQVLPFLMHISIFPPHSAGRPKRRPHQCFQTPPTRGTAPASAMSLTPHWEAQQRPFPARALPSVRTTSAPSWLRPRLQRRRVPSRRRLSAPPSPSSRPVRVPGTTAPTERR